MYSSYPHSSTLHKAPHIHAQTVVGARRPDCVILLILSSLLVLEQLCGRLPWKRQTLLSRTGLELFRPPVPQLMEGRYREVA